MKKLAIVALVSALVLMVSCTTVSPVGGATGKVGKKVGTASATWLLYPFTLNGDFGIATAAKNGGISTVGTIDIKSENMFLMGTITTIVTGE
jgi:hypothetical protein